MKRALDLVVATTMLFLSFPLLMVSAIAVRLTSKGPVLFEQVRWGRNGISFHCLKFRTMVADAEDWLLSDPDLRSIHRENGFKLGLDQDPRVTEVGHLLRKTYLDELPQLVNVIRGEMSLVGPRPIVEEELEWYGEHKGEYLSVRPGIFGAWTAQGHRRVDYPDRALVELEYVRNKTIIRDVQVLLRHIPVLTFGLAQGLGAACKMFYTRLARGRLPHIYGNRYDRFM